MNYCIAAFAIIIIISVIQWFVDGRKNYQGPHVEDEIYKFTETQGLQVGNSNEESLDDGKASK